jgi:predicted porin
MQKKIIAIAIAATLSAPAFADITAYGIIDGAIASVSGSGQKSDLIALSGGASTSRLGAKVSEDLGNGLTAIGVLEYGLDTETNQQAAPATTTTVTPSAGTATATSTTGAASNLAARQQLLGVTGSFGTVATGYLQTAGYDWEVKFDPLAGSSASVLQTVNKSNFLVGTVAVAARAQRAIAYISPDISGLTVAVNYSTALAGLGDLTVADSAAAAKTSAYLLSGTYVRDAFVLGLVYAATTAPTSAASQTEFALGGSYDLGEAKLLGTYQSNTTNSNTNSAYSASVVVPVGSDAVAAQYATNSMTAANSNGSGFTLGYLKTLSKTTTAYAAYSSVTNGSATHAYSVDNNILATSTLSNGGSSNLIAIGLRKKF